MGTEVAVAEALTPERVEPAAYVWAHRYFRLYVEEHESLEEAVRVSSMASDEGSEAIECIEVPAEGRVYGKREVFELWDRLREQEEADAPPPEPPYTHQVQVLMPYERGERAEVTPATADWFRSLEAAEAEAARLAEVFGAERVLVKKFP